MSLRTKGISVAEDVADGNFVVQQTAIGDKQRPKAWKAWWQSSSRMVQGGWPAKSSPDLGPSIFAITGGATGSVFSKYA
jgi:hypothetical protein